MAASEPQPGGPAALEQVFLEHHTRVFRAARRITGNIQDAEDVLQTVFLRLARREAVAAPVANLPGYLHRAAVNAALDLLRARRAPDDTLRGADAGVIEDRSPRPDQAHEAAEVRRRLRGALARLNPRAGEVFSLRYLEGFDNAQIAAMLGTSRVAVAVTLHRARRRLQGELRAMRRDWR